MESLIQLSNIQKKYGEKQVLSDINLTIHSGDILGYIGPNGAGKTTTIKIICGLCKADSGLIQIGTQKHPIRLGVIFDYNGLYQNLTAKENLEFFARLYALPNANIQIQKLLELVGLINVSEQRVKTFSKGMSRRLALARAFLSQPDILIMDEPFDGLDVQSQYIMFSFLKKWAAEDSHGILITSHNMKEIQDFCNCISFLQNGKICLQGSTEEILQQHFKGLRIHLQNKSDMSALLTTLSDLYQQVNTKGSQAYLTTSFDKTNTIIKVLINSHIPFREITEVTETLEEIYIKEVNAHE